LVWVLIMEAQLHQTREVWLNYVVQRMAPLFEQLGTRYRRSYVLPYLKRPAQQEHRRMLG
jgi:hypothetical protein